MLCRALRPQFARVLLVSHAAHRGLVESRGGGDIEFIAADTDPLRPTGVRTAEYEPGLRAIEALPAGSIGLVAFNLFSLGAWHIATKVGSRCVALSPCLIPYQHPARLAACFCAEHPALYRRLQRAAPGELGWAEVAHWMWPLWGDEWAEWRQERLGLHPLPLHEFASDAQPVRPLPLAPPLLYGFSESVLPPHPEWPASVRACGFWRSPEAMADTAATNSAPFASSRFSALRHPIYVGMGSCTPLLLDADGDTAARGAAAGSIATSAPARADLLLVAAADAAAALGCSLVLHSCGYAPLHERWRRMLTEAVGDRVQLGDNPAADLCASLLDPVAIRRTGLSSMRDEKSAVKKTSNAVCRFEIDASRLEPSASAQPRPVVVCLVERELPLDGLFPRCGAALHHGGAGTCAAALHAGARRPLQLLLCAGLQPLLSLSSLSLSLSVSLCACERPLLLLPTWRLQRRRALPAGTPQLVMPLLFDQFAWAERIEYVGEVGEVDIVLRRSLLMRAATFPNRYMGCGVRLEGSTVLSGLAARAARADAVCAALRRVTREETVAQCADARERLRREDGVGVARRAIEGMPAVADVTSAGAAAAGSAPALAPAASAASAAPSRLLAAAAAWRAKRQRRSLDDAPGAHDGPAGSMSEGEGEGEGKGECEGDSDSEGSEGSEGSDANSSPRAPRRLRLPDGSRLWTAAPSEAVHIYEEIFTRRCYLPPRSGIELPTAAGLVLDAGANLGLFSIWLARASPQVQILACEPAPPSHDLLQRNLQVRTVGVSQSSHRPCPHSSSPHSSFPHSSSPHSSSPTRAGSLSRGPGRRAAPRARRLPLALAQADLLP